ncbi:MAG: guanylate kinase [Bacteroides sp.]
MSDNITTVLGKALVFSAPSGSGKTTLISHLQTIYPQLRFSVSATSRAPRDGEKDGEAYYFLSAVEFQRRIERGDFIEWEEVYEGNFYGTLRSEVQRLWARKEVVLFDIDVKGAFNLKRVLGDLALTIFIAPPSREVLRARLIARGSETEESLIKRLERYDLEMQEMSQFDRVVVNDNLEKAKRDLEAAVKDFLAYPSFVE